MIEHAILHVQPLSSVGACADEPLTERVLLAIIAALAAVLVPGLAGRLLDTPLTWEDLGRAARFKRPPSSYPGTATSIQPSAVQLSYSK